VLLYHGLTAAAHDGAVPAGELKYWLLSSQLREHLAQLRQLGCHIERLGEAWAAGRNSIESPVVLSFDDGRSSDYELVFPLLLEAGATAEFFVNTATLGTPGFLTWAQVREMHQAGMSFQSHGHDHVDLSRLAAPVLERQLGESRRRIEDWLGAPVEFLAMPYGLVSVPVLAAAREQGYRAVCTSRPWPARPGAPTIGRVAIYRHTPAREVRQIVERRPAPYLARAMRAGLLHVPRRILLRHQPGRLGVRVLEGGT
jgi:peptidoglycan/xylan/chitin deacetylase (PgdA/CDA1 family)